MKVTLIRPPAYSVGLMGAQRVPYLGIAYVAAACREAGHTVDIIDMCGENIDRSEIVKDRFIAYGMPFSFLDQRLKSAQIIGVTCMFSQDWVFHRGLIQYVKKLVPDARVVAGGEHVTAIPEYCLNDYKELDICVLGEGEKTFVKLLKAIEADHDFGNIAGLVYRDKRSGTISHTAKPIRQKNIDDLPLPAWDAVPLENYLARELNYHIQRGRTIPVLASRGCPYACTFCSNSNMWDNMWLGRDPVLVVDEMELYIEKYQIDNFVFSDLTAVVNRKNIEALCREILDRGMKITWQLPTLRTESLDRQVLALMYQAGCRELDFAVESGSRELLSQVNKGNDPATMVALIKDSLQIGMNLSINIIIGLPGERFKDFLKSYLMCMKLALSGLQEVNVFPFIPYPGSKLFNELQTSGALRLEDDFFTNLFAYADLSRAVSWSEHFGPKTLRAMRLFLLASFYGLMLLSHPFRLVRLIRNVFCRKGTTKFEGVVGRIFSNLKIYHSTEQGK